MYVDTTAAAASAALAAFVGLLSHRISTAPGCGDQRRFRVVALSAATYAACNLFTSQAAAHGLVPMLSRLQTATALVHLWGWFRYSRAFLEIRIGRGERIGSSALLAAAAAAFVPGFAIVEQPVEAARSAFGFPYVGAEPTLAGILLLAASAASSLPVVYRFARAWRSGVPYAGIHAGAFGVLVLFAANDALVGTGVVPGPYLLHVGFAAAVLAVGWVITGRFVESSRALERLQGRLALEVEARTNDLASALGALNQVEKLAALGQFANGVAHEVNSPASVVTANLSYLREACRGGAFPADGSEVVEDAQAAMARINHLVRKLVDAGRVAAAPVASAAVRVLDVASSAAENARARLPPSISLSVDVAGDLLVRARRESVAQVLDHLLANAVEAIPAGRPGRIQIRAERAGGAVRIEVADDGVGMAPDVLRRALEPFFTTRPAGHGAGLGLSVARGLVEAHGGALSLRSAAGAGTTAVVELPEAAASALTPPPEP
ncbi:MAG TPA: HAMP domain-containing sensor histidine kinase [Anaeromyxobacter sp.]